MFEWWNALSIESQVFYCIAIPATLIVVIQTILLLVGLGNGGAGIDVSDTSGLGDVGDIGDVGDAVDMGDIGDGGNPADFGIAQLFTLQGVVTFLCVLGWSGVVCTAFGLHIALTIAISLVLGFLAMLGVAKIIQLSAKLAQNGNIDIRNLLGQKGSVYIPIPESGKGQGKIMVSAGEVYGEFAAITDEEETIPTGKTVRIIDIRGDLVVVEIDT